MSNCILVTGSPYSGKSILAGTLHHLGIYMGTFEHPPKIYSRKDIYEDKALVQYNSIATNSLTDNAMIDTALKCLDNTTYSYDRTRKNDVENAIKKLSENYDVWGYKDPRFLFPNIWDNFIKIAKQYSDIKLIVSNRGLEDIVKCYERHKEDYRLTKIAVYYFLLRTQFIFQQFNGHKMIVGFDTPLNRPKEFVQSIADFAEVPIAENAMLFVNGRNERAKKDGNP